MKYVVEMGSAAIMYIPSFINTGLGIQKLMETHRHTYRQNGDLIGLLFFFFQNKESGLTEGPEHYSVTHRFPFNAGTFK
jgi:hypothetical protein